MDGWMDVWTGRSFDGDKATRKTEERNRERKKTFLQICLQKRGERQGEREKGRRKVSLARMLCVRTIEDREDKIEGRSSRVTPFPSVL